MQAHAIVHQIYSLELTDNPLSKEASQDGKTLLKRTERAWESLNSTGDKSEKEASRKLQKSMYMLMVRNVFLHMKGLFPFFIFLPGSAWRTGEGGPLPQLRSEVWV